MPFPILTFDKEVFSGDKVRIDASRSFFDPNETAATISHEISFDDGATWINISEKKYIDYGTFNGGETPIKFRLTSNLTDAILNESLAVLDIGTIKLFSRDFDLYSYESDIDQYLPKKWSSWNLVHYNAQKYILDWLDEKRIYKSDGSKYTAADLLDKKEVRQFSIAKTLEFIFESNSKIVGDVFSVKRDKYRALANEKASRMQLTLDANGDTILNDTENRDIGGVELIRGGGSRPFNNRGGYEF
jgi:hypothetical protein